MVGRTKTPKDGTMKGVGHGYPASLGSGGTQVSAECCRVVSLWLCTFLGRELLLAAREFAF